MRREIWATAITGAMLALVACSSSAEDASPARDGGAGNDGGRAPIAKADATGRCSTETQNHCGGKSDGNCWCDEACSNYGDCCPDYPSACTDAGPPVSAKADPSVWLSRTIYLALPDRFFNGDASNDQKGEPGCFNPSDAKLFHGGDLAGITQKIDYLSELGADALWLTPLYRQAPLRNGACGYHGYWANFADPDGGELEPKLGSVSDASKMRDALHAAGIKLIIDMVVNHPARNAKILGQHADWFHDPDTCASLGPTKVFCPLNGLPDFAQEKPEVAEYLTALSRGWVERIAPDGIRMDTAQHVAASYFATSWTPGVRSARADLFTVAEVFDEGPYDHLVPMLDAGFDSVFDFPLRRALVSSIAKGGSLDLVAGEVAESLETLGLDRMLMKTNLLDNHDTARFLSEVPAGTPDAELWSRYRLALVALFSIPGIPQIYSGDELGAFGTDPDNRRDMPAWAWQAETRSGPHAGYLSNADSSFSLVKKLAALRQQTPALHAGYYSEMWRPNGGSNVYSFYRASGDSRVLVVINAGASKANLTMSFATKKTIQPSDIAAWPDGTVLEDALAIGAPAQVKVTAGKIPVSLDGKTAAIYRSP